MKIIKAIKAASLVGALALSGGANAGTVKAFGQKFKTYDELADFFYGRIGLEMENAITSRTLSSLDLKRLDGSVLVILPSLEPDPKLS